MLVIVCIVWISATTRLCCAAGRRHLAQEQRGGTCRRPEVTIAETEVALCSMWGLTQCHGCNGVMRQVQTYSIIRKQKAFGLHDDSNELAVASE